ncbi:hypothetical protein DUT91_07430 [Phyllobacterium salinisoli]|uniref:DUF3035 domain-containing protein n=1 Tax=Phyllobacterium salinisoli TaxID=1899321 RepID=A0A368K452_9HYPH|nr:hypothetical protein [Phyllobacterium salinisoli]RCS24149.1 hypothetical protein DUT91_07430 [Phyllobacterium salinisoli]
MSQHVRLPIRFILISLVLAGLAACARGPEFQGTPQEGALNTDTYPTFGRTPKGETKQLTAQDTARLKSALEADKARQMGVATPPPTTGAQLDQARRQAQQAADETIKEIETETN